MNIFYRGYVIREDIRSICYTIFGRRPGRQEIYTRSTARDAMQWIDREVSLQTRSEPARPAQLALL